MISVANSRPAEQEAAQPELSMVVTRRATEADLGSLRQLYLHLNPNTPVLSDQRAAQIWSELLSRDGVTVFVRDFGSVIIASCTLITVPNLMRGGRPHGLLENVVTHTDYRRQGHGRAVVTTTLDAAWEAGCHNVILLTGRNDPAILSFYRSCGFETGLKTGYVARRPTGLS